MRCATLLWRKARDTTLNAKGHQRGLYQLPFHRALTLPLRPWDPTGRVPYEYNNRFRGESHDPPTVNTQEPSRLTHGMVAGTGTFWPGV